MKTIRKITNKVSNNISGLAGSALLVGATLTGGAAFAAAQDSGSSGSSMDLGDYPAPFVDEDGNVETSIVLGSDAAVTDVVGATEIAGSLGNAAFGEETVSAEGGSFGWTADRGVTLDTRNDQLYFGDHLDTVRETLTEDDLDILGETTFTDDENEETDVTNYLNVGELAVQFGTQADELDNEDPELHVEAPSESDVDSGSTEHVFNLQANFEDGINFTEADVAGEEIELFGTEYTIADDNEVGERGSLDSDELLLYGSQQEVDVNTGESVTITVNDEEVTIETVSVNEGGTSSGQVGNAAVRVAGTLESVESGDTISVNDEEVRIDEIIKTGGSDSSDGVVNFKVGSQELTLIDGEPIQDSDGDDIEGSRVYFNGHQDGDTLVSDLTSTDISTIDFYVGAEDDDEDAIMSGETFTHSALPGVEVHFAGLNPDASEDDTASEVEVGTSSDDTATLDFTAEGGDDASVEFAYTTDSSSTGSLTLEDSDQDDIQTVEGAPVSEDEYFLSDAGDFSHMWEVTGIDRDTASTDASNYESSDEAEIDLRDAVTGDTVTVDLDIQNDAGNSLDNSNSELVYEGNEVIDGQKYYFELEANSGAQIADGEAGETEFAVAWGDDASVDGGGAGAEISSSGLDLGSEVSVSPALDTESGSAVTVADEVDTLAQNGEDLTLELPTTDSTDSATVTFTGGITGSVDATTNAQELGTYSTTNVGGGNAHVVRVNGGQEYIIHDDGNTDVLVAPAYETSTSDQYAPIENPTALTIQPEDDNDVEHTFAVTPGIDGNDEEVGVGDTPNNGEIRYSDGAYSDLTETLESDDDMDVGYNFYGTYTEQDTDDQGSFVMNIPDGQSVAGAAVTEADGSLSTGGGSGSVEAASATYQYADGVLADDGNIDQVKNNDNVVLVGGPAANSLTQELVTDNQTMPASDYTEGQGMVQLTDGFPGGHALVVAGATGEDTRAAAEFLADYRNNGDALEGQSQVTIETQSGTVVE